MSFENIINNQAKLDQFKYWFIPRSLHKSEYSIYLIGVGSYTHSENLIGTLLDDVDVEVILDLSHPKHGIVDKQDILSDFKQYQTRVEYLALQALQGMVQYDPVTYYKLMLTAGVVLNHVDDYTTYEKIAMRAVRWLDSTDFFTAPASTQYHDSHLGGLLTHTLHVLECMSDLTTAYTFEQVCESIDTLSETILCACCHDWCKIGLYEKYLRNVKNENTGQWEQATSYRYKKERFIEMGHGVSSMYLAMKFFPSLSKQACLAIRWHMGEYNVASNEMNELHQANETYPMVQLLQFADRLSITKYVN